MTAGHLVADVLAVSAQVACVVAVATLVAMIVRIDTAAVRYQYWRAVLLVCVLLPWVQDRQAPLPAPAPMTAVASAATSIAIAPVANASTVAAAIPWLDLAAWLIAAGIVFRLARIGLGLLRLARVRRAGRIAPRNSEHDELQWALGTDAEIRYVNDGQPITCGARRPVVLLPESLLSHSPAIQRAVLVHELVHVQRRDWIWVMGEELLCAVVWFHPGVWWLISQVRRAREEVVDEVTVLATGQRRAYLEALLVFADGAEFVPSAAFARRAHLFRRMMLISKEAAMSSKRVVVSCVVLGIAVLTGSWYAVGAFPMMQAPGAGQPAAQGIGNGAGPLEQRAKPITPENPIPRRTFSVTPQNPADAPNDAVMVTLRIVLDQQGRVAEVRSVRTSYTGAQFARGFAEGRGTVVAPGQPQTPPSFTKAAFDAVRQWQYDPPADAPIAFDVTFAFVPGREAQLLQHGDSLQLPRGRGVPPGGVVGGVVGGIAAPPPPPPPPPPPGWAQGAIRVGGNVLVPTKTKNVAPEYPALAKSAGVQGVVIIEAIIGTDGHVQNARILRSIPLLDQAALDAVKQWEFTPTMLNGAPVPVIMTMTVQFALN